MKCLIYCTKAGLILRDYRGKAIFDRFVLSPTDRPFTTDDRQPVLNGKIIAEFDGEVEEITKDISSVVEEWYSKELLKKSCLTAFELDDYLKGKKGYAIHINNLKIFDKPRALHSYSKVKPYKDGEIKVARWEFDENLNSKKLVDEFIPHYHFEKIRPPQNMMKVYDKDGNEYVLISIRPEWACKILNGEKTIEVRKQVLNCMKEE